MRVLAINAPDPLARDLHQRASAVGEMTLMIAGPSNPLAIETLANDDDPRYAQFVNFSSRRKVDLAAIGHLRQIIRDFKPDIVHSFLPRPLSQTVLATIGMRRAPKIVSFYGITRVPTWRDPADWITYLSPKVAMHACESNAVKDALMQGGVRESKCEVIYNCVGPVTDSLSKIELRAKYEIPKDSLVIGTVATMRPVKGIDLFLEALIQCATIPNWVAVLIGPVLDPKVASLANDPRLSGRIRLLGQTDNAATLMQGMDLFVMPSRKEGLCRALLEAMGQGVCPIVSDAGGMKELVRNGVDGIVFPSENVGSLSNAIRELHAEPARISRYGQSAIQRVESMCDPKVVGDRVFKMYQRLAA
jgi:glycosyltransferase involved in cell wall biosynthesis